MSYNQTQSSLLLPGLNTPEDNPTQTCPEQTLWGTHDLDTHRLHYPTRCNRYRKCCISEKRKFDSRAVTVDDSGTHDLYISRHMQISNTNVFEYTVIAVTHGYITIVFSILEYWYRCTDIISKPPASVLKACLYISCFQQPFLI